MTRYLYFSAFVDVIDHGQPGASRFACARHVIFGLAEITTSGPLRFHDPQSDRAFLDRAFAAG